MDRDTTATNTVSGTLAGSGTAWWTTDGSSSSTGTDWSSSYSYTATYPGFYTGAYYGYSGSGELLEYVGDMFGSSGSGGYTFAALALPGGESGDVVRSATFIDDSPELVDAKKGKKDHHNKGHGNGHGHGRKGDWQTVEGEDYGGEYSYIAADAKREPSATWTLEGLEPGKTYQVLVTWVADPANATSTTWTIADGSGGGVLLSISDVDQTELRADATLGGQTWQSLAIVTATSGAMVVRLDAAGSSGRVVADAVAMVEVVQAVESGQNGRDGDVVLAAAAADGGEGWSWLDCIPGVGAVLRWNESFDRRAAERDRLAAIIAQGNFESVAALQQSKANGLAGGAEGIIHSFELQVDAFTTAPAIAGLITEVGTRLGSRVPSTVQVTSWAESGVTPDLNAGRWVQTGGPTYWNYIKTGLWGGKIEAGLTSKFPWIFEWRPSNVPFSNYITSFVEQSRLMWPPGWEFFKGMLGQRVLR